ncbi:MAG TPA: hypothetical protein VFE47_02255 [Tepidisphaeraceae bacterium]|jgi:hypothetical protein|nr:hypothetical protein [Tepidisphaeraceae bacterium]
MNESIYLHLFLAGILIAMAAAHFIYKLRSPHTIGVADLAVWMTALYFGIAPWFVFLDFERIPFESSEVLLRTYFVLVTFLLAIKFVAYVAEKAFPSRDTAPPGVVVSRLWIVSAGATTSSLFLVLLFYYATVVLRVAVGEYYGMFLSGERFAQDMPEWVGILLYFAEVFKYGAVVWGAAVLAGKGKHRLFAVLILVTEFLMTFGVGRRWIVADVVMFLIIYLMFVGFRKKTLVYYIVGAILVIVSVSLFQRVRYYRWTYGHGSGIDAYITAISDAIEDADKTRRTEAADENLGERPLEMPHFCMRIVEAQLEQPEHAWMQGDAIVACLVYSIPHYLYPDKRNWPSPEGAIKRHFAMDVNIDMGSSWPAYGIGDFGMLGGFYVGAIFGLTIVLAEGFARFLSPKFPYLAAGIVGTMLMYACQVQEMPSEIFASLRNDFALGILCVAIMPLVRTKWFSQDDPALPAGSDQALESTDDQTAMDPVWPAQVHDFG